IREDASIITRQDLYNAARVGGGVPAIQASQLTKRYGTVDALKGIDLAVEPGEFFGLFGPNGAGKTTMLRILTGQLRPTTGEARVLHIDVVQGRLEEFRTEYGAGGGTAFMACHRLDIAAKLCRRVGVIRSGSIIATGTGDESRAHGAELESGFIRLVGAWR